MADTFPEMLRESGSWSRRAELSSVVETLPTPRAAGRLDPGRS